MRIVSDDKRVLNELFTYLDGKNIEIEKFEYKSDKLTDKRPMDGLLETILAIGANGTTIAVNLTILYDYVKLNYPNFELKFIPFNSEKVEMSFESYTKMSDNAKNAISEHYDVLIKKK